MLLTVFEVVGVDSHLNPGVSTLIVSLKLSKTLIKATHGIVFHDESHVERHLMSIETWARWI